MVVWCGGVCGVSSGEPTAIVSPPNSLPHSSLCVLGAGDVKWWLLGLYSKIKASCGVVVGLGLVGVEEWVELVPS